MDYTKYYCNECQYHMYDAFANAICMYNSDMACKVDPYYMACFRFKLKEK